MNKALIGVLIVMIVIAHVFLWRSDMATDMKIVFTTINALAWIVILAPAFLVGRWLTAVETRNKDNAHAENPDRGQQSKGPQ
jgi:hypothetical protein